MGRITIPNISQTKKDSHQVVQEWLELLTGRNLVNGELVQTPETLAVINPATMTKIGQAAASGAEEVSSAVDAASVAQTGWAELSARQRGRLLADAGKLILEHAETLSVLLAMETGKAIKTECRGEVAVTADLANFYGGLASELKGQTIPFDPKVLAMTVREPLGVVGAIVPWNVPVLLTLLKIAPALAAGNSVVVKASEEAPFTTIAVGVLMDSVLPKGVLNVVCGTGVDCGAPLCANEKIAKITFTGSEAVGETIYKAGASRIVPVSLELGGKSPMIVCSDANLDKAVDGAVKGMRFTRQGQSCTAASRIYVHADLYESFVSKLKAELDNLVIGDPLDETTDIGTIISAKQKKTIEKYITLAEDTSGVTVERCSSLPEFGATSGSDIVSDLFMRPMLVLGAAHDSPLVQEEIFGPVTCIIPWEDYDEVIEMANGTHYGLAATVWTNTLSVALDATKRINSGYVQVNQNLTIQPNLSYGGFGRSGLGREASLEAMIEHFTRSKTIAIAME